MPNYINRRGFLIEDPGPFKRATHSFDSKRDGIWEMDCRKCMHKNGGECTVKPYPFHNDTDYYVRAKMCDSYVDRDENNKKKVTKEKYKKYQSVLYIAFNNHYFTKKSLFDELRIGNRIKLLDENEIASDCIKCSCGEIISDFVTLELDLTVEKEHAVLEVEGKICKRCKRKFFSRDAVVSVVNKSYIQNPEDYFLFDDEEQRIKAREDLERRAVIEDDPYLLLGLDKYEESKKIISKARSQNRFRDFTLYYKDIVNSNRVFLCDNASLNLYVNCLCGAPAYPNKNIELKFHIDGKPVYINKLNGMYCRACGMKILEKGYVRQRICSVSAE